MPRIDVTKNYIRKRQEDPKKFDKRSFRTKTPCKNKKKCKVKIVLGCPKGKYNSKSKKCKVPLKVQTILEKREK